MSSRKINKLSNRLAMWEQASNTGIGSVSSISNKNTNTRKSKSVSSIANVWENRLQKNTTSNNTIQPKAKFPKKQWGKPKTTTIITTTTKSTKNTNTNLNTIKNRINTINTMYANKNNNNIIKPKPKNIFQTGRARAVTINLAALKPGYGIPPSLKKKREEAAKKHQFGELTSLETFGRPIITSNRSKRTRSQTFWNNI